MIRLDQAGDDAAARTLDALPGRIRNALRQSIERLTRTLADEVRDRKLSGETLTPRSGRLRGSIAAATEDDGTTLSATVSTALGYARAQEFGFRGVVSVRQHLRTVTVAFGRSIMPRAVTVRAHPMRMALPERSFLRAALHELDARGTIRAEIENAVTRSTA